jgi:CheY-like chemotaxis protein
MGVQTPIVALTAAAMQGDREKCIQAGCDDYTSKPIHGPRLVELVARYTRSAGGRRVLLVDDNVDLCRLTSTLLEMNGHQVRIAHTGRAGLESAREFQPHAVLLDLGLPDMNGLQVGAQLRAMPELDRTLLIALSGHGEPEDRRRTQAAGFDHHVVKPASAAELQKLILEGTVAR